MDRIILQGLVVKTKIGVTEEERREPREVRLDLELESDLAAAAGSDDLGQSVDYAAVAEAVRAYAAGARSRLIERLAASVATLVLKRFPRVQAVIVTVAKPDALPGVGGVGVRLRRTR